MAVIGVNYDVAWNGSSFVIVAYDTTASGAVVEFAESFEDVAAVFEGTLSSTFGVSTLSVGKIGIGGDVSTSTGSAYLSNSGVEGKVGSISGNISISTVLFGSFGDAQIVFEGSMGATLSAFESEISGGAGVGGAISTQIITVSMLTGLLGASGSYTISLDNLASYIDGLSGVSGQISASISSGAGLAGKLGISGEIVTSIDHLSLQLIEIVMSDRIYQIVISTKTGQAVFLAPKFGTIEITTEN